MNRRNILSYNFVGSHIDFNDVSSRLEACTPADLIQVAKRTALLAFSRKRKERGQELAQVSVCIFRSLSRHRRTYIAQLKDSNLWLFVIRVSMILKYLGMT